MNLVIRFFLCVVVLQSFLTTDLAFTQTAITQEPAKRSPEQLRGEITPERAWWDLLHYDLAVEVLSLIHI